MSLTEKSTVIADSIALLKYQFKDKENFTKYCNVFFKEAQTLEAVFFDILTERFLDTAVGSQLDGLGKLLGIDRNSLTDDEYRYYLYFQVGKNVSKGTHRDVIGLLRIITGANIVYLRPYFPASLVVGCDVVVSPEVAAFINEKFQEIVGAGIKFHYIINFDDTSAFGYGPTSLTNIKGYGVGKYASLV